MGPTTEANTEENSFRSRTALEVTLSVWRALFLREMLARLSTSRSAPIWLFLEPVFHVAYMLFLYTVIRMRVIGGIDTTLWLLAGILPFILFRRVAVQGANAVGANFALFTYRQVKPVDTVLVRSAVELLIMLLVGLILVFGVVMLGHDAIPDDPLSIIISGFGIWLLALGWVLTTSVLRELIPESGNIFNMIMMPLYLMSGAIFPIANIPYPYRDWLMLNPLVHGLESIRQGFSSYYHAPAGLEITYLYGCAIVLVFIGLALHRHFALRLATQ